MRIKKMAKKLLATVLILTMIAPYMPSLSLPTKQEAKRLLLNQMV